MMTLTIKEKYEINDLVQSLKKKEYNALQSDYEHSNLLGLYQDIINETAKHGKATIIYDYAKLLEEHLQLYSAQDIYSCVKASSTTNVTQILMRYLFDIENQMQQTNLTCRQQVLFNEICDLLGDARGLITDFTETYRRVFGTVYNNLESIIRMACISKIKLIVIE